MLGDYFDAEVTPDHDHGNDLLQGGSGDDILIGGGKDDDLYGGSEADFLYGDDYPSLTASFMDNVNFFQHQTVLDQFEHGNDRLFGEAGADYLEGQGGNDALYGGSDNDCLIGDNPVPGQLDIVFHGKDYLDGAEGDDTLEGGGDEDELWGGEGKDTLIGDSRDSTVVAEDWQERDRLHGGDGDDILEGNGGADRLWGDDNNDKLDGGKGNDVLEGGDGADTLDGGADNDTLDGGAGADQLLGGAGDDTLYAREGYDTLRGGEGKDTYFITAGSQYVLIDSDEDSVICFENVNGAKEPLEIDTAETAAPRPSMTSATDGIIDEIAAVITDPEENRHITSLFLFNRDFQVDENSDSTNRQFLRLQLGSNSQLDVVGGLDAGIEQIEFADGITLAFEELVRAELVNIDTPHISIMAHRIIGTTANDELLASTEGYHISGGKGDDRILLKGGGNTIFYQVGDGADTLDFTEPVTAIDNPNILKFAGDLSAEDVYLTSLLTLEIGIIEGDSVSLEDKGGLPGIDRLAFADGVELSYAQLVDRDFDLMVVNETDTVLTTANGENGFLTQIFDNVGHLLRESWFDDDGSFGNRVYFANGVSLVNTTDIDGNWLSRQYDISGVLLKDSAVNIDGSTLDNIYIAGQRQSRWQKADGFSGGGTYWQDGSFDEYTIDLEGTRYERQFSADGYFQTKKINIDGSFIREVLQPNGVKITEEKTVIVGDLSSHTIVYKNTDGSAITIIRDQHQQKRYIQSNKSVGMLGLLLNASNTVSPLILDLNGDGISTLSVDKGVYFDHEADHFAEKTGWLNTEDGLLVRDINGDGQISSGRELFGSQTQLQNGQLASDGFNALLELDSNADLVFDSHDSSFAQLHIWRDANTNGVVDYGELQTLAQAGVASIELGHSSEYNKDDAGNYHGGSATFTTVQGLRRQVEDVWFTVNTADSLDQQAIVLSPEFESLPDLPGYGRVASLQQAMARDQSGMLTLLVKRFSAEPNATIRKEIFEQILFHWAGVEEVDPNSRGEYIGDARKLEALEAFWGYEFRQLYGINAGMPEPGPNASAVLLDGWSAISNTLYQSLMLKTHFSGLMASLDFDFNNNGLLVNIDGVVEALHLIWEQDQTLALETIKSFGEAAQSIGQSGWIWLNQIHAFAMSSPDDFSQALTHITDSHQYSVIGTMQADMLQGVADSELLLGHDDDDRLAGAGGNDTLNGGMGKDTYIFNRGDGFDVIDNSGDIYQGVVVFQDVIQFGEGISRTDLLFYRQQNGVDDDLGSTLDIGIGDSTDILRIENYFVHDTISQIQLADGTVLTRQDIVMALSHASAGPDVIYGADSADILDAEAGHDLVFGYDGEDLLIGGAGNDALNGGADNDTLYGGEGNDQLFGNAGDDYLEAGDGSNSLSGGAGDDQYVLVNSNDRIVELDGEGNDTVFSSANHWLSNNIENLILVGNADVTGVGNNDDNQITSNVGNDSLYGAAGNDTIAGAEGNDLLVGDYDNQEISGNDELDGGAGNDTLSGGGGHDLIHGGVGNDILFADSNDDVFNGDDQLYGEEGDDELYAHGGHNLLDGGSGDDRVTGGSDHDLINGGTGNDILAAEAVDSLSRDGDFIDGGTGDDVLIGGRGHDVLLGGDGNDQLQGQNQGASSFIGDHIDGGNGNDLIHDSSANDLLIGGAGNDEIYSIGGNDTVLGGDGSDRLWQLDGGLTLLQGGMGQDSYVIDFSKSGVVYLEDADSNSQLMILGVAADELALTYDGEYISLSARDMVVHLVNIHHGSTAQKQGFPRVYLDTSRPLAGESQTQYTLIPFDLSALLESGLVVMGTAGADGLIGSLIADQLYGADGDDTLTGGAGNDTLTGGVGDDTYLLQRGDGSDLIVDGGTLTDVDRLLFAADIATDDIVLVHDGLDLVLGLNDGANSWRVSQYFAEADSHLTLIDFADGSQWTFDEINRKTQAWQDRHLLGTAEDDVLMAGYGNDVLEGLEGNDVLYGGAGADTLIGGMGNDSLVGGEGLNQLQGGAGSDIYYISHDETDVVEMDIYAGADEDIDTIVSSVTKIHLVERVESLILAEGSSALDAMGNEVNNYIIGNSANNYLSGAGGDDELFGRDGQDLVSGEFGNDQLFGGRGDDSLFGGVGDDTLYGNEGDDVLFGGADNDILTGQHGNDTLDGGAGYDVYRADVNEVTVIHDVDGAGLITLPGYALADQKFSFGLFFSSASGEDFGYASQDLEHFAAAVEVAYNLSNHSISLKSIDLSTMLVISDLDAATVREALDYTLDFGAVLINRHDGSLVRNQTYQLGQLIANSSVLSLGSDDADLIIGLSDIAWSEAPANTVNAGSGVDTVYGGNSQDVINGDDGNDQLYGNNGHDSLNGGLGADYMEGGDGDDVYWVDTVDDQVVEAADQWQPTDWWGGVWLNRGNDTVISISDYQLVDHVENLTLMGFADLAGVGNQLSNIMRGNQGNNQLSGQAGEDRIFGAEGSDQLAGGEGSDDLWGGAEADQLAGDDGWDELYGEAGNDTLMGGADNDILDGGTGADLLVGGSGYDRYYIDNSDDQVIELAGDDQSDSVYSAIDYLLTEHVENLYLLDDYRQHGLADALSGQGNALNNYLQGNAGCNRLVAKAGDDTLDGGGGDDHLFGGDGNDNLRGGVEEAQLQISHDDDSDSDILRLVQITSSNDVLDGGAGDDTLDGGAGDDSLFGGDGNDSLYGGADNPDFVEIDESRYYLEDMPHLSNNDVLDGGLGDDYLSGGSGNDTLLGGADSDIMDGGDGNDVLDALDGEGVDYVAGGLGDDVYWIDGTLDPEQIAAADVFDDHGGSCGLGTGEVDYTLIAKPAYSLSDQVSENQDEGYDIVYSSVSMALTDNIEEVHLTGTDNLDVIGSTGNDLLIGNSGNNLLAGGTGEDSLYGGEGNDAYFIDQLGDSVVELLDAGHDTVVAAVDGYQLGDNLENLYLAGGIYTGSGNAFDNLILGNTGDNSIYAQDGNDRVRAAQGSDTVSGGLGDDTYVYYAGDGDDLVIDDGGLDTLHFSADIIQSNLRLSMDGADLVVRFADQAGSVRLQDWANSEHRIESLQFCGSTRIVDIATLLTTPPIVNHAPVAQEDVQTLDEDNVWSATGNVLVNDTDLDDNALLITNAGRYELDYGVLTLATDGSYQYELYRHGVDVQALAAGEQTTDRFVVTVTDDGSPGATAQSLLIFTIDGRNDAPVVLSDRLALSEDDPVASDNVLVNDSDIDHGAHLSIVNTGDIHGIFGDLHLTIDGSYSYQAHGDMLQLLAQDEEAQEQFDIAVSDGFATVVASLHVTVTGQNDAPITQADSALMSVDKDVLIGNVLVNDSDIDQGTLLQTLEAVTQGQYGTLTLAADGAYQYALNHNLPDLVALADGQIVNESFSYLATDGISSTDGVLNITLVGRNDAPVLTADTAVLAEDAPGIEGNVLANDSDPDQNDVLSTITTTLNGRYGTLTLDHVGHYSYQLNNASVQQLAAGMQVIESFSYQATDGKLTVNSGLNISITGLNDAPETQEDAVFFTVGEAVQTGNVLTNDRDVDQGTILQTVAATMEGQYGVLSLSTDGSYQYVQHTNLPDLIALSQGDTLMETFSYQATDGITSVTGALSMTIAGRNDAPILAADAAILTEDSPTVQGNVLANDADPDQKDQLSVVALTTQGQYGTLVLDSTGHYTYQLNDRLAQGLAQGETVVDSFSYTATDSRLTASSTLAVTISGLNDAPVTIGTIAEQTAVAGQVWRWTLPETSTLFKEVDVGDSVTLNVTQANGAALPGWLQYNTTTRELSGTPPTANTAIALVLSATDHWDAQAILGFNLAVQEAHGVTLTGTTGDDTLTGTAWNDTLNGGAGSDTMIGGAGDDVYYVDTLASSTCDAHGHGNEGVGNGEDPPPPGHDDNDNDGPGTSPGNPGRGHHGNNGHDQDGCDDHSTTCSSATGDQIVERLNQGYDTVYSTVSYSLSAHLEAIVLLGNANLDATANSMANRLTGNNANNTLTGLAGNDTYVFDRGWAWDTIVDKDSTINNVDVVLFGDGIAYDQLWLRKSANNLELSRIGTQDKLIIKDWYSSPVNHVEQFRTADGHTLDHGKIAQLVQAMAMVSPPASNQTTLSSRQHRQLDSILAASWS